MPSRCEEARRRCKDMFEAYAACTNNTFFLAIPFTCQPDLNKLNKCLEQQCVASQVECRHARPSRLTTQPTRHVQHHGRGFGELQAPLDRRREARKLSGRCYAMTSRRPLLYTFASSQTWL